jgi:hypothetical protein
MHVCMHECMFVCNMYVFVCLTQIHTYIPFRLSCPPTTTNILTFLCVNMSGECLVSQSSSNTLRIKRVGPKPSLTWKGNWKSEFKVLLRVVILGKLSRLKIVISAGYVISNLSRLKNKKRTQYLSPRNLSCLGFESSNTFLTYT